MATRQTNAPRAPAKATALPADFFGASTGELLGAADYARAAHALACDVVAIEAMAEVGTKGQRFDEMNRPTILCEHHLFANTIATPGKFNGSHPDLSADVPCGKGGYGPGRQEYGRLERAWQLDPHAALLAPSRGKFQILGNNHNDRAAPERLDRLRQWPQRAGFRRAAVRRKDAGRVREVRRLRTASPPHRTGDSLHGRTDLRPARGHRRVSRHRAPAQRLPQ